MLELRNDFYSRLYELLGSPEENKTIGYGRWRRGPGSGRYKGRGVIRYYSETNIHVMFYDPKINKIYSSIDDLIIDIQKLI
jgi:hypothetical protein